MTRSDGSEGEGFSELEDRLRGALIRPDDEAYDEARSVWNEVIDKHPGAIAECTGVADVIAAVNVAREHDLRVAVRSGGHDYAGTSVCDDGLVIDLSAMDGVRVDPVARTARVGPGVTWRDFYHETEPFGLTTPGGLNGVGVAGFTLGGGIGYLSRKHGLTVDNLRSVDVVTADGEVVQASEDRHPELFWALRGGRGSFGVVTSFEFDLHEVGPEVLVGRALYPHESLTSVFAGWREHVSGAPDALTSFASVTRVPDGPGYPEDVRGEPAAAISAVYSGEQADGKAVLDPLGELDDPIVWHVEPQTPSELADVPDSGIFYADRFYSKSQYLGGLPDAAIRTIERTTRELPGTVTMVAVGTMGGAMNRVDPAATAFPHRDAAFEFDIWPAWRDPDRDRELMSWAREFHEEMSPHATGGVYANLLSHDEADRIEAAYGQNYDRLRSIKADWDPENVFRSDLGIPPR